MALPPSDQGNSGTAPQTEFDRVISEFIGVTAHKIHTPVSAIKWQVEMLLAGDLGQLSDKQRESLQSVMEEAERLNDLSRALLYVFELEKDLPRTNPQEVNLHALLARVTHHLSPILAERKVRIADLPCLVSPNVYVDPDLAFIVLRTLLENAVIYSSEGGVIDVRVEGRGDLTDVSIEDHGCGIPQDMHHLVFTKFFRAPNGKRLWTEGTGLGLYLSATIAKRVGWELSFKSEEGKGSTFRWTIPKHTVGKQPWERK